MKEAENVKLVEGDPSKNTKVGEELQSSLKDEVVKFLKRNLDVFAWNHKDMLGISKDVIEHCLNVNSMKKPIQQRRRVFSPEWNKAIMEEVEKLLTAGFIQEVHYLKWLANVILVKKFNEKWRMDMDS